MVGPAPSAMAMARHPPRRGASREAPVCQKTAAQNASLASFSSRLGPRADQRTVLQMSENNRKQPRGTVGSQGRLGLTSGRLVGAAAVSVEITTPNGDRPHALAGAAVSDWLWSQTPRTLKDESLSEQPGRHVRTKSPWPRSTCDEVLSHPRLLAPMTLLPSPRNLADSFPRVI